MPIIEGLRNYLDQVFPKRQFDLLVDERCIDELRSSSHNNLFQLIIDLKHLIPPIDIRLLVKKINGLPAPFAEFTLEGTGQSKYSPNNPLDDDPRAKLMEETDIAACQRRLCALSIAMKSDGIVTADPTLLEARYALADDFIYVLPINELEDFVEICAHGHNVFWSASYSNAIYQDVYYILAHPKCSRLARWWETMRSRAADSWVIEQLQSLILNRYQFILYARDMVRFSRLQYDHSKRQGNNHFGFSTSYHVNQFYFLLWGMLDQLALISNHVLQLGLNNRSCGISKKDYLSCIRKQKKNLSSFLSMPLIAAWITLMSDFRHSIAHQIIPIPTEIIKDTEDSKRPTEEIVKILRNERDEDLLDLIADENLKSYLLELKVQEWRMKNRKRIADYMVLLNNKDQGYYFWSPVISIDHDLAMLTGIMDAFLVCLFCSSDKTEANVSQPRA